MSFDPPLIAPLSEYVLLPELPANRARDTLFRETLESSIGRSSAEPIKYGLPYPKHEFLRFVAEGGHAMLHGSNDRYIEVMTTERRTIDARLSHSGAAVFACADGLWPMYYALLDRASYQGTLRNDARRVRESGGAAQRAYYLSLNGTAVWREGVVYLLPPATFSQLGDESSLEWISPVAVRPFTRLDVCKEDFPLLDRVRTHDDTPVARMRELSLKLVRTHVGFDELADGYVIRYPRDEIWAAEARELISLLQAVNPWLKGDVELSAGAEMSVRLHGSPALKDMLGRGLAAPH